MREYNVVETKAIREQATRLNGVLAIDGFV